MEEFPFILVDCFILYVCVYCTLSGPSDTCPHLVFPTRLFRVAVK